MPEHHGEEAFTATQIGTFVAIAILLPLVVWALKLAITRALSQADDEKKAVELRLINLEKKTIEQDLALKDRPTFEQLTHAKDELRNEFRGR